jgi:hypothetical protein
MIPVEAGIPLFAFDVIPAQAGLSTAELVIHFGSWEKKQDQDGSPLSR